MHCMQARSKQRGFLDPFPFGGSAFTVRSGGEALKQLLALLRAGRLGLAQAAVCRLLFLWQFLEMVFQGILACP